MSGTVVDEFSPFIIAGGIVVLLSIVWYLRAPNTYHKPAYVWARVAIFSVPGAALALYSFAFLPGFISASEIYMTDPSCLPGSLSDRPVPAGPCRVDRVALDHAVVYYRRRSGDHYYVTATFADGSARSVELAMGHDGRALFNGVRVQPATAARAQLFGGQIIMLTSDRGTATTVWLPQRRAAHTQTDGGIGIGLLFGGFLYLLVSWRIVFGDAVAAA